LKLVNFGELHTPEPRIKCAAMLTEDEEQTLQQLSINHPYQDMHTRAAALLMLAGGKLRPMAIGAKLGVCGQSIYDWAHTWREQGVIGLLVKIGHRGGRPRALSDEMIAAVVCTASVEPLTRKQIVQRLEGEFGSLPFGHLDTSSVALNGKALRSSLTACRSKKATRKHSP
jgi:transposase